MNSQIPRTATFAWSPAAGSSSILRANDPFNLPLLATGTVSGALDASFSNEATLEIWSPFAKDPRPTEVSGLDGVFAAENGAGIERKILASLKTESRFNSLAWGSGKDLDKPRGIIAAGMENGELEVWDAGVLLDKGPNPRVFEKPEKPPHNGPVKALAFSDVSANIFATGSVNGEIFIWDLTKGLKPFSPGERSRHLDDITSISWNRQVPHIVATSSSSGYTSVWDLKGKREAANLSYAGGATGGVGGGAMGPNGFAAGGPGGGWMGPGMGPGGRRGISAVCWHPDNPTRLATASEDDSSPIIMLWDLRNSRAPEKILAGHEKGILSLSWCARDSGLLLSTGKDCRTLCWNPDSAEIVAELPPSNNWSFQVQWCPRNPDILATASFDERIRIHSLQSTSDASQVSQAEALSQASGADIFSAGGLMASNHAPLSLKQPPKWLRRPVSASFGFAGKLVTVSNIIPPTTAAPAGAQAQPDVQEVKHNVNLHSIVTEPVIVERAIRLEEAKDSEGGLAAFCVEKEKELQQAQKDVSEPEPVKTKAGEEAANWKLLSVLFGANSREELVTLLGFSKEDVKGRVEEAIKTFKSKNAAASSNMKKIKSSGDLASDVGGGEENADGDSTSVAREPLVSFAEPTNENEAFSGSSEGATSTPGNVEGAPSEASVSATSDAKTVEAESEITEPSLFGDDNPAAPTTTQQQQAAADFYSSIRSGRPAALPDHIFGNEVASSSVAATQGSRASSVISESIKATTFKIYPTEEGEAERLITRALVLGDFDSAVSLCLSSDRFADALLLAVRGGPELLAKTQKAYFEKRTTSLPYLRLFQSIVSDDLTDVVQNADLAEWQEIFVVLCTFANQEEFSGLAEQLGDRLQYQSVVAAERTQVLEFRKNAVLCYLAAGKLERVVNIWIEEMKEDEDEAVGALESEPTSISRYTAHAKALQTFIEKVTVFQGAVNYTDAELQQPTQSTEVAETGTRSYKLSPLYDRYCEYAELLATQGLVTAALKYISKTPSDYKGTRVEDVGPAQTKDRLVQASGNKYSTAQKATALQFKSQQPQQQQPASTSSYPYSAPYAAQSQQANAPSNPYGMPQAAPYQTPVQTTAPTPSYTDYNNPYGPPSQTSQPAAQAPMSYSSPYSPPSYASPYGGATGSSGSNFAPAPPPILGASPTIPQAPLASQTSLPPPPTARKEAATAWNDAPMLAPTKRAGSAAGHKTSAITSPFPNSPAPPSPGLYNNTFPQQPGQAPPPPPSRGATRTPAQAVPPPPRAGQQQPQRIISPPPNQGPYGPPQPMNFPGASGPQQRGPNFPLQGGAPGQPQFNNQFAPGPGARATPPPQQGPYGAPGTFGQQRQGFPQPGPYVPPQQQQQLGQGPRGQNGTPPPGPGQVGRPPQGFPGAGAPPRSSSTAPAPAPPAKPQPPKSKYPHGDRSHIPDSARPIFNILSSQLQQFKQAPGIPPRMAEDAERRLNILFDALNCETLSSDFVQRVLAIANALDQRQFAHARQLHLEMLTAPHPNDDLSGWAPGIKAIIPRA